MKKFVMVGALAAGALGMAAYRLEPTPNVAATRLDPPRIAVVDMARLVSQTKRSKDEQALIIQWRDAKRQMLEETDKRLRLQKAELDAYRAGSEEHHAKSLELRIEGMKLENEAKWLDEETQRKLAKSISEAHARVTAAAQSYLESHDLDAVLQYSSTPVDGDVAGGVISEVVVRCVVAHRKAVDVTDAVLEILEAAK